MKKSILVLIFLFFLVTKTQAQNKLEVWIEPIKYGNGSPFEKNGTLWDEMFGSEIVNSRIGMKYIIFLEEEKRGIIKIRPIVSKTTEKEQDSIFITLKWVANGQILHAHFYSIGISEMKQPDKLNTHIKQLVNKINDDIDFRDIIFEQLCKNKPKNVQDNKNVQYNMLEVRLKSSLSYANLWGYDIIVEYANQTQDIFVTNKEGQIKIPIHYTVSDQVVYVEVKKKDLIIREKEGYKLNNILYLNGLIFSLD